MTAIGATRSGARAAGTAPRNSRTAEFSSWPKTTSATAKSRLSASMPPRTLGETRHDSCLAMCHTNRPTTIRPGSSHGELSPRESRPERIQKSAPLRIVSALRPPSHSTPASYAPNRGARKARQVSGRRVPFQYSADLPSLAAGWSDIAFRGRLMNQKEVGIRQIRIAGISSSYSKCRSAEETLFARFFESLAPKLEPDSAQEFCGDFRVPFTAASFIDESNGRRIKRRLRPLFTRVPGHFVHDLEKSHRCRQEPRSRLLHRRGQIGHAIETNQPSMMFGDERGNLSSELCDSGDQSRAHRSMRVATVDILAAHGSSLASQEHQS